MAEAGTAEEPLHRIHQVHPHDHGLLVHIYLLCYVLDNNLTAFLELVGALGICVVLLVFVGNLEIKLAGGGIASAELGAQHLVRVLVSLVSLGQVRPVIFALIIESILSIVVDIKES